MDAAWLTDLGGGGSGVCCEVVSPCVTVTTSLGTMVREGFLLYGSSKAAAESAMAVLAADLAGSGVTSNVLVPGGTTDTPLVGEAPNRDKMLRPAIMVPPLLWLLSDEARTVSGKRFIAADWDTALPAAQAAEKAGAAIAWLSIARMPIANSGVSRVRGPSI